METALLVAAVLIAGLACPTMMWWQRRRGREAACCVPRDKGQAERATEVAELRRQRDALSARLSQLRGKPRPSTLGGTDSTADG